MSKGLNIHHINAFYASFSLTVMSIEHTVMDPLPHRCIKVAKKHFYFPEIINLFSLHVG